MSLKSAENCLVGDTADGLRRRNVPERSTKAAEDALGELDKSRSKGSDAVQASRVQLASGTYWLTRIVLLRYIAFIYCVAFLVAFNQNTALIGKNGLLPADVYIKNVVRHSGDKLWNQLQLSPTLLLMLRDYDIDTVLRTISGVGFIVSAFVVVFGCANIFVMLLLWTLYHSIVNVGQRWYSFGWESQLLETGFLAAFLCPWFSLRQLPWHTPTSTIVILAFRWLIFRIMIGAGLIKIRGDRCWWELTCMNYHYETQPVPNPLSYYMHKEPDWFHQVETMTNHLIELPAPFLLLINRRPRMVGGLIQIGFQLVLIFSGNLSFLNWLTIAPCLACFDDASLSFLFSDKVKDAVSRLQHQEHENLPRPWSTYVRKIFNLSLGVLIAYLSIPVVQNLFAPKQVMNTSFDTLRLVNTYGAFGHVTKERTEVIFQGTYASNPNDPNAEWSEYEFMCKPGNVTRRPCIITPYHYRLDWLMWFAAFQNYQHNPWIIHLAAKFLANDETVTSLIAHNPFHGRDPPKWIRAEHYRYEYTKVGSIEAKTGAWWSRQHVGRYMPPLSLEGVTEFMKSNHWRLY